MKTFNNDPALKQQAVDRARSHVERELLMQGTYRTFADDSAGRYGHINETPLVGACSIGCHAFDIDEKLVRNMDTDIWELYAVVADHYKLPPDLIKMMENGFESCITVDEQRRFHVAFLERVPVGVEMDEKFQGAVARMKEHAWDEIRSREVPGYFLDNFHKLGELA